ncbi:MAG: GAF domain-containing protein, partial [Acidobacteria bacterium]|nr:GAF domain-containing protein [Acidobacteriota bacterium]
VAGFVASSGQPMAVSDTTGEEAFYAEVDRQTGYSTEILLATPLRHNDEVIGVLEFVNRKGDPPYKPFSPEEMDKAALFADAIAPLVNAYESAKMFRDIGEAGFSATGIDTVLVRKWLNEIRGSAEYREMMEIAILIRDIASRSAAERQLCREMLETMIRYADQKDESSYLTH